MENSLGLMTEYKWNVGEITGNINKCSDSFGLMDNAAVELALFVENASDNYHGYFFGLQLMNLVGDVYFVDLHVKVWIQCENKKGDDHIVDKKTFKAVGDRCEFCVPSSGKDYEASKYSRENNHSLIIHCELRCLARPSPYARKVSIAPQPLRLLAYKSYEKGIGADVTIHAGGNIFRVSSLILVSQSEVFESMLSGNFKEANSKTIPIKGVTAQAMESFIRYLYLGNVNEDDPIEDLFELGAKYLISDLKVRCAHLMTRGLSTKNIARRLVISHLHEETPLKKWIQEFIESSGPSMQEAVYNSRVWAKYLNTQAQI